MRYAGPAQRKGSVCLRISDALRGMDAQDAYGCAPRATDRLGTPLRGERRYGSWAHPHQALHLAHMPGSFESN